MKDEKHCLNELSVSKLISLKTISFWYPFKANHPIKANKQTKTQTQTQTKKHAFMMGLTLLKFAKVVGKSM